MFHKGFLNTNFLVTMLAKFHFQKWNWILTKNFYCISCIRTKKFTLEVLRCRILLNFTDIANGGGYARGGR